MSLAVGEGQLHFYLSLGHTPLSQSGIPGTADGSGIHGGCDTFYTAADRLIKPTLMFPCASYFCVNTFILLLLLFHLTT